MRFDRTTTRRPTTRRRPMMPRAFTMIELIVVMAIIVILLGIVVVGFKHVAAGNQKRQTQTLLERLKNITGNTFANKATANRFFQAQVPTVYSNSTQYFASSPPTPPPLPTPPDRIWDGVPASADDSLFKTGVILKALLADPEAKRIFDDLPSERKRVIHFRNADGAYQQLNGEPLYTTQIDGTTTTFTLPLDAWGNPILFVFDNWRVPTGAASDVPKNSTVNVTPVPQPTGGLTDLYSVATKTYWQFVDVRPVVQDPNYVQKYAVPMATPTFTPVRDASGTIVPAFRSPDNRPFWASAGPDGNYATHDDNVYSFEN